MDVLRTPGRVAVDPIAALSHNIDYRRFVGINNSNNNLSRDTFSFEYEAGPTLYNNINVIFEVLESFARCAWLMAHIHTGSTY